MPEIDVDAYRASLWPTLRAFDVGSSPSFTAPWFVGSVGKQWGLKSGSHAEPELHVLTFDFLWDAVRVGLLVPTAMNPSGAHPYQNYSFAFTELGNQWRAREDEGLNPFGDSFLEDLLEVSPELGDEPIMLICEARRAVKGNLRRAAMFLLGLMNEDLLNDLYDVGIGSGKVIAKASKRSPGKPYAMQEDVRDALAKNEPDLLSRGFASEWSSLVGTLRDYRNKCAHRVEFEPALHELHAALFMLPRLAELTHGAHKVLAT